MSTNSEKANDDASCKLQSSLATPPSSSLPKQKRVKHHPYSINHREAPQLNIPLFSGRVPEFSSALGVDNTINRGGTPYSHPKITNCQPYSQILLNRYGNQSVRHQDFNISHGPSCIQSLSTTSSFSLASLPTLTLQAYKPPDSMCDQELAKRPSSLRIGVRSHSCKSHRRYNYDIPFEFSRLMQSSPPRIAPLKNHGSLYKSIPSSENSICINSRNIDVINYSGTGIKKGDENWGYMDIIASGSNKNGYKSNDNEQISIADGSGSRLPRPRVFFSIEKMEVRNKRNVNYDIAPTTQHFRSVSLDTIVGNTNLVDVSPNMLSSPVETIGQSLPASSVNPNLDYFSLGIGNGEFSGADLNKITRGEKVEELVQSDLKRAKRILSNRKSSARSKERKMRYTRELERKAQNLHLEATTMSSTLTSLQRDSDRLTSQNNALKVCLHAMKQQAQLRDELNNSLASEVQRLKHATAGLSGGT